MVADPTDNHSIVGTPDHCPRRGLPVAPLTSDRLAGLIRRGQQIAGLATTGDQSCRAGEVALGTERIGLTSETARMPGNAAERAILRAAALADERPDLPTSVRPVAAPTIDRDLAETQEQHEGD
ncbi:hypothetical protein AB0H76_35270 [Nocardia sp. NPDC050712]|uniref:hypothetical protein n=1 Tax=Nocardia sp. NPDC050712 TaxID=3155518 RepID=UPI0034074990